MNRKIGLIGGAGPIAGSLLFQQIIQICQKRYSCKEDADFPYILLLSYPFANMLKDEISDGEKELISKQLEECFTTFNQCGVTISAIACNTLHGFVNADVQKKIDPRNRFIHMLEETRHELSRNKIKKTYVLASNTSAKLKLHQKYFDCCYPDAITQSKFQEMIDCVLAGGENQNISEAVVNEINRSFNCDPLEEKVGIVLGCTEFSVLNNQYPLTSYGLSKNCQIFDTSLIVAEKITKIIYEK